jgi:hypothetical protein
MRIDEVTEQIIAAAICFGRSRRNSLISISQEASKEARQNPSLLQKRILGCSSIFTMGKNPQCIAADTSAVFPHR